MHAIQIWGVRGPRLPRRATTAAHAGQRSCLPSVPPGHSFATARCPPSLCIRWLYHDFTPSLQALAPGPAAAGETVPTVQGSLVKQQQAELQRLLEERGAKLPELKASPSSVSRSWLPLLLLQSCCFCTGVFKMCGAKLPELGSRFAAAALCLGDSSCVGIHDEQCWSDNQPCCHRQLQAP